MSAEEVFKAMDAGERRLAERVRQVVKRWLNRIPRENTTTLALGELYGWWAEEVDDDIVTTVRGIWLDGYYVRRKSGLILRTSLDGLESYMARVKDRLVRGIEPPLPDAAFNMVRNAVVMGAVQGWSRNQTAQHIAASLSWEKDGAYWREFKGEVDEQIDAILDPLGAPGTAAREYAKNFDPRVISLRGQRNVATKHLDAEHSYWHDRAIKIARTESTGAFNAAGLSALHDEGYAFKEWLATEDARTRPTHRAADGQVVALTSPFQVGGSSLQIPGDPTGPPHETVNCRCTILGADGP